LNLGLVIYPVILVAILAVASSAIRVMREYQRAVVFTFGRFTGVKGPGLFLLVPYVQQMVRVDLRTVVLDVPSQDVISRDNVSVKVNAVLYFRVVDADKAVIQIENFLQATSQLAQTTLRSVLGKHTLDEMLGERDKLSPTSRSSRWTSTTAWSAPSPVRPRLSASAAPRSSMPKASNRLRRSWWRPPRSWQPVLGLCSCATWAR
jgi:regulator of protease activity HflC (stomatin/prohibitin superfamily)